MDEEVQSSEHGDELRGDVRTNSSEGEGIIEVDLLVEPLVEHHSAHRGEVPRAK